MRNLLLIDDNELLGQTLRLILGKQYHITVCHTGVEGLCQAFSAPPTAILCDLTLPDIHGSEVIQQLQSNPVTREVPIIIITGNAQVDSGLERNFSIVRKPFTAEQIRIAVINAANLGEENEE